MSYQALNKSINPRSVLHELAKAIDDQFETDFEWDEVFATFTVPTRFHVHSLLPLLEAKVFTDEEGKPHDIHQVLKVLDFEYSVPPPKTTRKITKKVPVKDLEARIAQLELLVQQLTTQ
jgi:hypothetical protein